MGHSAEEALCRPVLLRATVLTARCHFLHLGSRAWPVDPADHQTDWKLCAQWETSTQNYHFSILNDGGAAKHHICLSAWQLIDFELILRVSQTAG